MNECIACKWFKLDEPEAKIFGKPEAPTWGECWRYPPQCVGAGSVSASQLNGFSKSVRPSVRITHGCGEFRAAVIEGGAS